MKSIIFSEKLKRFILKCNESNQKRIKIKLKRKQYLIIRFIRQVHYF